MSGHTPWSEVKRKRIEEDPDQDVWDYLDGPNQLYAAVGLALVPFGDEEEHDYFEWHHCEDQPNCFAKQGQPCACSGMPWPSPAVRAAVDVAFAAGRRAAAEAIRDRANVLATGGTGLVFREGGQMYLAGMDNAARIAEGSTE